MILDFEKAHREATEKVAALPPIGRPDDKSWGEFYDEALERQAQAAMDAERDKLLSGLCDSCRCHATHPQPCYCWNDE